MGKTSYGLALLVISAWVGGMWAIGYLAAPVIFQILPDRQTAGILAGKLFSVTAYMGMVCAGYLLAYCVVRFGKQALGQRVFWIVAIMLFLTVIGQFGIQPVMAELKAQALPEEVMRSMLAGQFRIWHGVASILYLVQSLLGGALVLSAYTLK